MEKIENNSYFISSLLKKTLFFFKQMTYLEIYAYAKKNMKGMMPEKELEEKIKQCLKESQCFIKTEKEQWEVSLEGIRKNDAFYNHLLKKQSPVFLKEANKKGSKGKKKAKPMAEESSLGVDGRFVCLDKECWGLTEWEVKMADFPLKQLIIKILKEHEGGLSLAQIEEKLVSFKSFEVKALESLLSKFPYFKPNGAGIFSYDFNVHLAYESVMNKFLASLQNQKDKWLKEKDSLLNEQNHIKNQLHEVEQSYRKTATALALKLEELGQQKELSSQIIEKDLLLSLRKKEILLYREQMDKLERKAENILSQCRIWVNRFKHREEENRKLSLILEDKVLELQAMSSELQEHRDKELSYKKLLQDYQEREQHNLVLMENLREEQFLKVSALQEEIGQLKSNLDKTLKMAILDEQNYKQELGQLQINLKEMKLRKNEAQRELRYVQEKVIKYQEEKRVLDDKMKNPLVQFSLWVSSLFNERGKYKPMGEQALDR